MAIDVLSAIEQFVDVQRDWDRLARCELRYFPNSMDVYAEIVKGCQPFRLIVDRDEQGIRAMAFFWLAKAQRSFWVGERKLFNMAVRQALLQGSAILGDPDARLSAIMLDRIMAEREVTFVDLGEVDKATGLYSAAQKSPWNWLKHETDWRTLRRIIALPSNFHDYLASLRSSTRKAALRDQRIFAKLNPQFRVMTRPEEMRDFLRDAAIIGDKTYQSGFGMSLDTSDWRLRMFEEKAKSGRLYAYIAYADGIPRAFAWGDRSYDTLYFRMTGYDPEFRKYCAGTAILLYVLEHLIVNGICARFDFGVRDMDYKERFATTSIACAKIIIGSYAQPSAVAAVALDRINSSARPFFLRLVGGRRLEKIKKIMRR